MKKNTRINRFGIYYTSRQLLEDNISDKIKLLKKKRKRLINDSQNTKEIDEQLDKLNGKRPCLVLKIYNANITIIPITKSSDEVDSSHIETAIFNRDYKSYIKTSVIKTISISKFKSSSDMYKNKKIPQDEIDNLLMILKKHYLE